MKLNENFVLRQVADVWIVLPLGDATVSFDGMLKLNETGVFLWRQLEQGADLEKLIQALTGEYEVTEERACADVTAFLEKLAQIGCLN